MLYILCLCACPQTCIFRLTLQIIKSLENLKHLGCCLDGVRVYALSVVCCLMSQALWRKRLF